MCNQVWVCVCWSEQNLFYSLVKVTSFKIKIELDDTKNKYKTGMWVANGYSTSFSVKKKEEETIDLQWE